MKLVAMVSNGWDQPHCWPLSNLETHKGLKNSLLAGFSELLFSWRCCSTMNILTTLYVVILIYLWHVLKIDTMTKCLVMS